MYPQIKDILAPEHYVLNVPLSTSIIVFNKKYY